MKMTESTVDSGRSDIDRKPVSYTHLVQTVEIGKTKFTGKQIRALFTLDSTDFTFAFGHSICAYLAHAYAVPIAPVSYTHLDVYKRQVRILVNRLCLYAVLAPGSLCVFAVDGIYNLAGTACYICQLSIYIFIMIIGKLED